jgi:tetratricopeptide (TPR) repeat protein
MVMPKLVKEGQDAVTIGRLSDAHRLFSAYLQEHPAGTFGEGVTFLLASLPAPTDEAGKTFLKQIERLQRIRTVFPTSHYAPWALCAMGELYRDAGWTSEANGLFEEFLKTYPDHPLAGRIMVEAGRGFLENGEYLESALIFRRVVEEPKWESHRLDGALGLATATARSKAWSQALYWYRVVEAEGPDLLRSSAEAQYYFGESELAGGSAPRAVHHFLTAFNLHPQRPESGMALNRLAQEMFKEGREFAGLWFAEQAHKRFPSDEAGRRGKTALIRWVGQFLEGSPSQEDVVKVYRALDDLEVYLSISWDSVLETALTLSQAPEIDIAEENALLAAKGYEQVGDVDGAISVLSRLTAGTSSPSVRDDGLSHLERLLQTALDRMKGRKAWLEILKFYEAHRTAFNLLPSDREHSLMIAEAFQKSALPEQALEWYDRLLAEHPRAAFREEILLRKIGLAEELRQSHRIRTFADAYLQEFPKGKWRHTIVAFLGVDALRQARHEEAIAHFSDVLESTDDSEIRQFVLRQRARAFRAMGRMEKAREDLRSLETEEPVHVHDVIELGDVLYDLGDYAAAESRYRRVLEHQSAGGPLKSWAVYRLGMTLERLGQWEEASVLLQGIRTQAPGSPEDMNQAMRVAAAAALDEFSLKLKPRMETNDGKNQP